jgi:hypothetical protein
VPSFTVILPGVVIERDTDRTAEKLGAGSQIRARRRHFDRPPSKIRSLSIEPELPHSLGAVLAHVDGFVDPPHRQVGAQQERQDLGELRRQLRRASSDDLEDVLPHGDCLKVLAACGEDAGRAMVEDHGLGGSSARR